MDASDAAEVSTTPLPLPLLVLLLLLAAAATTWRLWAAYQRLAGQPAAGSRMLLCAGEALEQFLLLHGLLASMLTRDHNHVNGNKFIFLKS